MRKEILIGPIFLFLFWSLTAYCELISPLFVPPPHKVFIQLYAIIANGSIFLDVTATLLRMLGGLGLAILFGVPAGILLGYSLRLYRSLEVLIDFFRSLPSAALFPVFMIIFGIGNTTKVLIVAFASTLIMLINSIHGVKACSQSRIMVARACQATSLQVLLKVIFWQALPDIFMGIRVCISISLVLSIVMEMFFGGTDRGLGAAIWWAQNSYRISDLWAVILITGVTGYCINKLSEMLDRRIVHYRGR